jgi:hypothetical protein
LSWMDGFISSSSLEATTLETSKSIAPTGTCAHRSYYEANIHKFIAPSVLSIVLLKQSHLIIPSVV